MSRHDYIPAGYKRIKVVGSLTDMFNTPFGGTDEVNCILHPRRLSEDFNALVSGLETILSHVDQRDAQKPLLALRKIAQGYESESYAARLILEDLRLMEETGAGTYFRVVRPDDRNYDGQRIFHEDHLGQEESVVRRGLLISCYTEPVTEWLRNEDAFRVNEIFHQPYPGAEILRFAPGDIWRHAGSFEAGISVAQPLIHRAPDQHEGEPPRLLLVGI